MLDWVTRKKELADAYGEFINDWPWDWFGTFTFREAIHPESANKIFNRYTHYLNRSMYGVRYTNRPNDGAIIVRGSEWQGRGVLHYHALIGRIAKGVRRFEWMEQWNKMAGFARIYPYNPNRGARYYLGKYVIKGGQIDLMGPVAQFRKEKDFEAIREELKRA